MLEVHFRAEKYGVPYFLVEREAKQSDPRKEAAGARARNAAEDLNVQVIRSYSWAAAEGSKNPQCKPVNNCSGRRDLPEALVSSLERWQPARRLREMKSPSCFRDFTGLGNNQECMAHQRSRSSARARGQRSD